MTDRETLTLAFAALTHIQDNYMTLPEIGEQALAAVDEALEKPQRTWVGLTADELNMIGDRMRTWNSHSLADVYVSIEAKLKEKNNGHS